MHRLTEITPHSRCRIRRDAELAAPAVATAIALFSMLFTWIGMNLGRTSRRHWERVAKISAGLLLVGFGAANGTGWL